MAEDWGGGDYGRMATELAPAAEAAVDAAGVEPGQRVLDVGCGTGNALMAAAARGALVTGVDPSTRLVEQARDRAAAAGVSAAFEIGQAEALPVTSASFDVTLSVFAVIFAADPDVAAAEMLRATVPGGVLVVTSWLDEGGVAPAGQILREALPPEPGPARDWHDSGWVEDLLTRHGGREVRFARHELALTGESPEAAFAEIEAHHPAWRGTRRTIGEKAWTSVRSATLAAFHEANEDPGGFRVTGPYLVTLARG